MLRTSLRLFLKRPIDLMVTSPRFLYHFDSSKQPSANYKFARDFMKNNPSYNRILYRRSPPTEEDNDVETSEGSTTGPEERTKRISNVLFTLEDLSEASWDTDTDTPSDLEKDLANVGKDVPKIRDRLNDNDLVEILKSFGNINPNSNITKSKEYKDVYDRLDKLCLSRLEKFDSENMLFVNDIWLNSLGVESRTFQRACDIFAGKNWLSPQPMVQAFFHLYCLNKPIANMTGIERQLEGQFSIMSFEEIAIASMLFYKTKTPLSSTTLLTSYYKRLEREDLQPKQSVAVEMVIKLLQLSYTTKSHLDRHPITLVHDKFAPALIHRLSKLQFDIKSWSSIAAYTSALRIYNKHLLEALENHLIAHLRDASVKDMAIICGTLNKFNFTSKRGTTDELFEAISKELPKRKEENQQFPQMLMECTTHLAERNIYDVDCIDTILKLAPDYVNTEAASSLLKLDAFASINLKSTYNGTLLSYVHRKAMAKHLHLTESFHSEFLNSVRVVVEEIYRNCVCIYPAAHFRDPAVFMVTAPNKVRAVDRSKFFPKGFGKTVNVTKITGDDPQLKVLAFVCAHETSCFTKGSGVELNGSLKFRNEQLKLLGVTPLVVSQLDWKKQLPWERIDYIRELVVSAQSDDFGKLNENLE